MDFLVELSFLQPEGSIAGMYTNETRTSQVSADTPEAAGEKALDLLRCSQERCGLKALRIVSVTKWTGQQRRITGAGSGGGIFPHG